ncbi:hypothetical protein FEM08_29020 [Flavobacterium gilvum]|nr:hypothetical protein FEM08_29020 [Flavobacterium gilvum]
MKIHKQFQRISSTNCCQTNFLLKQTNILFLKNIIYRFEKTTCKSHS